MTQQSKKSQNRHDILSTIASLQAQLFLFRRLDDYKTLSPEAKSSVARFEEKLNLLTSKAKEYFTSSEEL